MELSGCGAPGTRPGAPCCGTGPQRLTLALTIGRELELEARLAVGRDPLDAAIGGHALLKAALHQLRVLALLLHLR